MRPLRTFRTQAILEAVVTNMFAKWSTKFKSQPTRQPLYKAASTGSTCNGSTESHTYAAIPKNHIRLLRFSRVGDKTIVGKLETFKLGSKKCPQYIALSYTWGDKSLWSESLTVDGKRVLVLASLGPFINILRSHPDRWKKVWWWIDSICINQIDDDEKSTQVGQMSSVYHHADKVVVWLGEESEGSDDAIDFLHHVHKTQKIVAEECRGNKVAMSKRLKELGLISQKFQSRWNAVSKFFRRPWWTRVWTLQEFVIPYHLKFWCGTKTIRREVLAASLHGMWLCHDPHIFGDQGFAIDKQAFDAGWNRRRLLQYVKSISKGEPNELSLIALLAYFSNHKASDPRDRLFSLRGLAADAQKLVPDDKVNYARTVDTAEVYLDLVRSFIEEHQSLDIISFAEIFRSDSSDESPRLPTWVPDWRVVVDPTVMPLMVSQSAGIIGNLRSRKVKKPSVSYAASGPEKADVLFKSDSPTCMACKGIIIDTVDGLGGAPRRTLHVPSTSLRNAIAERNDAHISRDSISIRALTQKVCRSLSLDRRDTFLGDAAPMDQFMDDFGALCSAHLAAKSSIEKDFESWMLSNEAFKMRGVDIRSIAEHAAKMAPRSREPVDSIHKASFLRRFRETTITMNRRLMVSTLGHIGMAPITARKDDRICILFGCSVPVLLRPQSADSYEFVGECYLDGFMNGEALNSTNVGRDGVAFQIY